MSGSKRQLQNTLTPRLLKLLEKAIIDYETFANQSTSLDAKDFTAHQAACKAALAHLSAGLKLLDWAEGTVPADHAFSDNLEKMICDAKAAIARGTPID